MHHLGRPQDRIAHDLYGKDDGSTPVIRVPECGHGPQASSRPRPYPPWRGSSVRCTSIPRAGATPERVAREAALLSDEEGFDALALSGVAQRFGVSVPSLYKHVEGLPGVRRSVTRTGAQELGSCLREAVDGQTGADAWRAFSHAYRRFAHTRPGRYTALQRAPLLPSGGEEAALSPDPVTVLAEVLQDLGVTEQRRVPMMRTLCSALHRFVDLEANGGFGFPEDVDTSFDVLVEGCVHMLVPGADDDG